MKISRIGLHINSSLLIGKILSATKEDLNFSVLRLIVNISEYDHSYTRYSNSQISKNDN